MPLVATLIAKPGRLTADLVAAAAAAAGAPPPVILAEAEAADIALPATGAELALRDRLAGAPVDIVVQEAAGRRKSVLLADMDSTMIDQECIDELADKVGLRDHVAAITARSMNGEIAFEPALRERVALLAGLPLQVIDTVIAERITLAAGGRTLVATMRAHGAYAALVSGGFTAFTARIAALLGFDEHRANRLDIKGGVLSGTVAEPILGKQAKVEALRDIVARRGLTPADVIAVGDGANDLAMLAEAGSGVALHAKPAVATAARMRVDHGDLTALLFIQGYRKTDFST